MGRGFGPAVALPGGIQYAYSGTQNNGQITQATDTVSGETIGYQYDALKRLTSASSTPINGSTPTAWTQSFQYDGFGNLVSKTLNGGANLTPAVNPATNQLACQCYDLNGNMTSGVSATFTYDEANRMITAQEVSGGKEYYGYDAANKRVYRMTASGQEQITFYGAQGEKLGVYGVQGSGCGFSGCLSGFTPLSTSIWFGGRLLMDSGNGVVQDRLGTNRASGARFYPYGDEITSTSNDREKFGTYTRDSYTGLDYADQRFYASAYGNFTSPDPTTNNVAYNNPGSWNAYAYTIGDPINGNDPTGLMTCGDIPGANSGGLTGRTFQDILDTSTDYGLLAVTIFVESAGTATSNGALEMAAIGAVIMNRYNIVNGFTQLMRSDGTVQAAPAAWGRADGTLASIIINPTQFEVWQGAGGTLTDSAQSRLDNALDSDSESATCQGLEQAYFTALDDLTSKGRNVLLTDEKTGLAFTGFNSFRFTQKYSWEQYIGQFGSANKFYGVPVPIPVPKPRPPFKPGR